MTTIVELKTAEGGVEARREGQPSQKYMTMEEAVEATQHMLQDLATEMHGTFVGLIDLEG